MRERFTGWLERRKRERPYRRTDARCYRCGFLGAYFAPPGQKAIPHEQLAEIRTNIRTYWESELNRLRAERKIVHEYDPRQGQEHVLDTAAAFGVSCGLGQPQGAGSSWFVGKDDLFKAGGVLVEDPERPFQQHGLGAAVGKVQTDTWALVRPHDCGRYAGHRPGLTPSELLSHRDATRKNVLIRIVESPGGKFAAWLGGTGILGFLVWLLAKLFS